MPRRAVVHLVLLLMVVATIGVAAPAATTSAAGTVNPEAQRIIDVARKQVGDPWIAGSTGPRGFDCSGLVYYAFKQAGLLKRIGGTRRSASGYWAWFAKRDRASRTNPKPGDLVIWNGGSHIGIYLGDHKAISAIDDGVTIHKVHALTDPFTTYLHVRWKAPELIGFKR